MRRPFSRAQGALADACRVSPPVVGGAITVSEAEPSAPLSIVGIGVRATA